MLAITISDSYGNPTEIGIETVFEGITVPGVVVPIFTSEGVEFLFIWHAALPMACFSVWSNHYSQTGYLSNFYDVALGKLKISTCIFKTTLITCSLKEPKEISLFSKQMVTLLNYKKTLNVHIFNSCHANKNILYRNFLT